MAISGFIAGGVEDALADVLQRRMQEYVRQQQEQQHADQIALQREQLAGLNADRAADQTARMRTLDLADLRRRDENNQRGMDLMRADKAQMDMDAAVQSLPPHLKPIAGLFKAGAVSKLSPEDLQDPNVVRQNRLADVASEADVRARAAARYREPDRGRKSIQQVVGPNNEVAFVSVDLDTGEATPIQLPQGMAPNKPPKPITGAERQAVSFFNRMLEAERNARGVEDKLTGIDLGAAEMAPDFIENWLKSPQGQAYAQAQRTFTEGRLRKESGAAVPPGEYENDRRTNFRIAGDKPDTVKQKRGSRVQTMRGIGNSAGRALQEFYGADTKLDDLLAEFAEAEGGPMQKPIPGIPGAIAESTDGGKTWRRVK